jgi:hypothetical protein
MSDTQTIDARLSPSVDEGLIDALESDLAAHAPAALGSARAAIREAREALSALEDARRVIPRADDASEVVLRARPGSRGAVRHEGDWALTGQGIMQPAMPPEVAAQFERLAAQRSAKVAAAFAKAEAAIDAASSDVGREVEKTITARGARKTQFDANVLAYLSSKAKSAERFAEAHRLIQEGEVSMGVVFDAPSYLSGLTREQLAELKSHALQSWAPPLSKAYGEALPALRRRVSDARGAFERHYSKTMSETAPSRERAAQQRDALNRLAGASA